MSSRSWVRFPSACSTTTAFGSSVQSHGGNVACELTMCTIASIPRCSTLQCSPPATAGALTLHGLAFRRHCSVLTRNALWEIRICPPRATSAIALHLVSTSPLYSLQPLVGFTCSGENVVTGPEQLNCN